MLTNLWGRVPPPFQNTLKPTLVVFRNRNTALKQENSRVHVQRRFKIPNSNLPVVSTLCFVQGNKLFPAEISILVYIHQRHMIATCLSCQVTCIPFYLQQVWLHAYRLETGNWTPSKIGSFSLDQQWIEMGSLEFLNCEDEKQSPNQPEFFTILFTWNKLLSELFSFQAPLVFSRSPGYNPVFVLNKYRTWMIAKLPVQ